MLIIPADKEGAMETLLLDSIAEDSDDAIIVSKSIEYVDEVAPYARKYISSSRLKLKASLGVVLATQFPEKIFTYIDEQIKSVKWEDSFILNECFSELKKI